MKKCQNCGTKNADFAKQCNFCSAAFPEAVTVIREEKVFNHNESAEKKNSKKRIILFSIIGILVFSSIIGILVFVFSSHSPSKSETLYTILDKTLKEERNFVGTFEAGEKIDFTLTVKESEILISFKNGKYDTVSLSKNGLVFIKGNETITADETFESHKIYVAYMLMTSMDKNAFAADTKDFKESVLPHIKDYIIKDFDNVFHEDAFLGSICSVFATLKDEQLLKTYANITLPEDVENGETTFDVTTYDLQNFVLSQFKTAFKDSEKYSQINQTLKDAKPDVKDDFKANGTLTTKEGSIETLSINMKYNGKKYKLSLSKE